MNNKLVWFGTICLVLSALVGLNSAAMGQIRLVCPNGYYLASNYLCYSLQSGSANGTLLPPQNQPQTLSCPNGYYLAPDYKCYPYQSQTHSASPNQASREGILQNPANCNIHCQFETNFAKEKSLTKDTNSTTGFLEIDYDGEWEGSILDSNSTSASHDGVGINTIPFPCSDYGIYSVVVQKHDDSDGILHIKVVKEGNILKDGETAAAYGVVAVLELAN